jgi:hypothetical protein
LVSDNDGAAVLVKVHVTNGPVSSVPGLGKFSTKDCVDPDATTALPSAASVQL